MVDSSPARGRLLAVLLFTLAVVFSLIAFPASVAWMASVWLLAATAALARGERVWPWLAALLAILLIKRIDASWAQASLLLALAAAIVIDLVATIRPQRRGGMLARRLTMTAAWLALLAFGIDRSRAAHATHMAPADRSRPIACLGDSLSASERLGHGYANELRKLVDRPVLDLSLPGISAEQAAEGLPKMVAAQPAIVVIELGGHDYLQEVPRGEIKQRLIRLIEAAQGVGAQVILCEIPRGFLTDPLQGLERELAREYDLELLPDSTIREFVLFSPACPPGMWGLGERLSEDGLHPNSAGNRRLAEAVVAAIHRIDPSVARSAPDGEGSPAR